LVCPRILAHPANITPKLPIASGMCVVRTVLFHIARTWFSSMRVTPVSMRGVCVSVERNNDGCVRDIGLGGVKAVGLWLTHSGDGSEALKSSESAYHQALLNSMTSLNSLCQVQCSIPVNSFMVTDSTIE